MFHILGKMQQDGKTFHHVAQKSHSQIMDFKIFFSLIFPQVADTAEGETLDKGDYYNELPALKKFIN